MVQVQPLLALIVQRPVITPVVVPLQTKSLSVMMDSATLEASTILLARIQDTASCNTADLVTSQLIAEAGSTPLRLYAVVYCK